MNKYDEVDAIDVVIHNTVHKSSKKPSQIAEYLARGYQGVINMANPQSISAFSLREIIAIQQFTGSTQIHSAIGLVLGVDTPTALPQPLSESVFRHTRAYAGVVTEIHQSLEDRILTLPEKMNCIAAIDEQIDLARALKRDILACDSHLIAA